MIHTSGIAEASANPTDARHHHRLALVHRELLGIRAAADDAHHPRRQRMRPVDPLPHGRHRAGELHAGDLVLHGRAGVEPHALQQVGPIERGRVDLDQDFLRTRAPGSGTSLIVNTSVPP